MMRQRFNPYFLFHLLAKEHKLKAQNTEQRGFKPEDTKGKDIHNHDLNTNFSNRSSNESRNLNGDRTMTPDGKLLHMFNTKKRGGHTNVGLRAKEFSTNNATKRVGESIDKVGKIKEFPIVSIYCLLSAVPIIVRSCIIGNSKSLAMSPLMHPCVDKLFPVSMRAVTFL